MYGTYLNAYIYSITKGIDVQVLDESGISPLFYGEMKRQQIKCYELESVLGASPNTVRRWLRYPEHAPMSVVVRIAKILGISKTTLCQNWRW